MKERDRGETKKGKKRESSFYIDQVDPLNIDPWSMFQGDRLEQSEDISEETSFSESVNGLIAVIHYRAHKLNKPKKYYYFPFYSRSFPIKEQ